MPDTISIHKVKEVIGDEAVQKMIDEFAGKQLYIPKKSIEFLDDKSRNQYIKNLFNSGRNYQYIADKVELSIDRVKKIICQR